VRVLLLGNSYIVHPVAMFIIIIGSQKLKGLGFRVQSFLRSLSFNPCHRNFDILHKLSDAQISTMSFSLNTRFASAAVPEQKAQLNLLSQLL
jgi:hypothetical protein